jgi:hypothetical protein
MRFFFKERYLVLCIRYFQFFCDGKGGALHTERLQISGGRAFETSSQLIDSPANAVRLFLTLLYLLSNLFLSMLLCTFREIIGNLYFNAC